MRFSTKSSLALLSVYLIVLSGVALFMERRLRIVSDSALKETAQLIGREMGRQVSLPQLSRVLLCW